MRSFLWPLLLVGAGVGTVYGTVKRDVISSRLDRFFSLFEPRPISWPISSKVPRIVDFSPGVAYGDCETHLPVGSIVKITPFCIPLSPRTLETSLKIELTRDPSVLIPLGEVTDYHTNPPNEIEAAKEIAALMRESGMGAYRFDKSYFFYVLHPGEVTIRAHLVNNKGEWVNSDFVNHAYYYLKIY